MQKWLPLSLSVLTTLSLATDVQANCARPVGYQATVSTNTVEVQAINFVDRQCPDPSGMLRQNLSTHEVVRLADYCRASADQGGGDAFVDECVPSGTYRYGFATPYECAPASCGTDYYVEVTVADPLDPNCAREASDLGPTSAAGVPWSSQQSICDYGGDDGTPDWSCAASPGNSRTPRVVLGIQALALLLGVVFMKRRRSAAKR